MDFRKEHCLEIKFCSKAGKSATVTLELYLKLLVAEHKLVKVYSDVIDVSVIDEKVFNTTL